LEKEQLFLLPTYPLLAMKIVLALTLAVALVACATTAAARDDYQPPVVAPADNLVARLATYIVGRPDLTIPAVSPSASLRVNAIYAASMHDAINAIHPLYQTMYEPLRVSAKDRKRASVEAAILQAFNTSRYYSLEQIRDPYDVTLPFFTQAQLDKHRSNTDQYVTEQLALLEDSATNIAIGSRIGMSVALRVLDERADDGYNVPAPAQDGPCGVTGKWCSYLEVGKPGPNRGQQYSNSGNIKGFSFGTPEEFPIPPPLPMTSNLWMHSLHQTRLFGGSNNVADGFLSAQYAKESQVWQQASASDVVARLMVDFMTTNDVHLNLYDTAALFGRMYIIAIDSNIVNTYHKIVYNSWRPYQAIRELVDPTWTPVIPSSVNQEYPCGHCQGTSAALVPVRQMFGDKLATPVTLHDIPSQKAILTYTSWVNVIEDVNRARVNAGMHFPASVTMGQDLGKRIGEQVCRKFFLKVDQ
jgi:hypothetical protein